MKKIMDTLQIRLPKRQIRRIDHGVKSGLYQSRSEAIRRSLDRLDALEAFDELQKIIADSGMSKKDLLREAEKVRSEIYKNYI